MSGSTGKGGRQPREGQPPVQLDSLRSLPLRERVLHELTQLIETGTLQPGDRLPSERELSERLEVSRSTVREATRFLQALGMVEIRHGAGIYVRLGADPRSLREEWRGWIHRHASRAHNLLEVRRGLESFAAELAAGRANKGSLQAMDEALEAMEAAVAASDVPAMVQADVSFHHALCRAAGNPALVELTDGLGSQLLPERGAIWDLPGRPQRSLLEHRAIRLAIGSGETDAARRAVIEHMESVEGDMDKTLSDTDAGASPKTEPDDLKRTAQPDHDTRKRGLGQ